MANNYAQFSEQMVIPEDKVSAVAKFLMEPIHDRMLQECVRTMRSASKTADYYVNVFRQLQKHCEAAKRAQEFYRKADARLQELGVASNHARQEIIHELSVLL